jgi:hypothetical protein
LSSWLYWLNMLQVGEEVTLSVPAVMDGQQATVELYSSEEPSPAYVTPRMQLVERIVLPFSTAAPYMLELTFQLGQGEMQVAR